MLQALVYTSMTDCIQKREETTLKTETKVPHTGVDECKRSSTISLSTPEKEYIERRLTFSVHRQDDDAIRTYSIHSQRELLYWISFRDFIFCFFISFVVNFQFSTRKWKFFEKKREKSTKESPQCHGKWIWMNEKRLLTSKICCTSIDEFMWVEIEFAAVIEHRTQCEWWWRWLCSVNWTHGTCRAYNSKRRIYSNHRALSHFNFGALSLMVTLSEDWVSKQVVKFVSCNFHFA